MGPDTEVMQGDLGHQGAVIQACHGALTTEAKDVLEFVADSLDDLAKRGQPATPAARLGLATIPLKVDKSAGRHNRAIRADAVPYLQSPYRPRTVTGSAKLNPASNIVLPPLFLLQQLLDRAKLLLEPLVLHAPQLPLDLIDHPLLAVAMLHLLDVHVRNQLLHAQYPLLQAGDVLGDPIELREHLLGKRIGHWSTLVSKFTVFDLMF